MEFDRERQTKRKPDRVLSMLGIAARAGKVASGEFSTEKAVKAGKAYLVLTAEDASENTKKKFRDMADLSLLMDHSDTDTNLMHAGIALRNGATLHRKGLPLFARGNR